MDVALVTRIWKALDGMEVVSFEQRVAKSELVSLVASCLPPSVTANTTKRDGGGGGGYVRDVDLAASKARQLSVI